VAARSGQDAHPFGQRVDIPVVRGVTHDRGLGGGELSHRRRESPGFGHPCRLQQYRQQRDPACDGELDLEADPVVGVVQPVHLLEPVGRDHRNEDPAGLEVSPDLVGERRPRGDPVDVAEDVELPVVELATERSRGVAVDPAITHEDPNASRHGPSPRLTSTLSCEAMPCAAGTAMASVSAEVRR